MKNEKSVKTLTFRVALESLRTVWQVFGTFSIFQAKQLWEVQMLAMKIWVYVDNSMYDKYKKTMIFA